AGRHALSRPSVPLFRARRRAARKRVRASLGRRRAARIVRARPLGVVSRCAAPFRIGMPVMIDFAQALNPYGPHPDVLAAARAAALDRAPERTAVEARHALAELAGADPDGIVLGNGASDLLWTCARALVPSGAWLRIAEPTRGEFRAAALACNARVLDWRADPRTGFAIQLEALASTRADVLHLANPNSPTGASVPLAEVARMAARVPKTRIILDESFLSLSERAGEARTPMPENVVRIRSLTHDHALPGLRLGYVI